MPRLVILVSGYKRAGKDYCSSLVATQLANMSLTTELLSFAAPMKRIIATTFGISLEQLDEYKNDSYDTCRLQHWSEDTLDTETDFRSILQNFGTEAMKPEFGDNVWGELMANNLRKSDADVVIIPDYRYDLEADYLISQGFNVTTLHVRSVNKSTDTHSSETLPSGTPDFTIDNSKKDDSVQLAVSSYIKSIPTLLRSTNENN